MMMPKKADIPGITRLPPPSTNPNRILVAILEKDRASCELLTSFFSTIPTIEVVACSHEPMTLLTQMMNADVPPDVVVAEVNHLNRQECLSFIKVYRQKTPRTKIILFSHPTSLYLIATLLKAGAFSFASKHDELHNLIETISAAAINRRKISEEVNNIAYSQDIDIRFTNKEAEVIAAITSHGYDNKELAIHFGVDEDTIKAHMTRIFSKARLDSRTQLVLFALTWGFITLPQIQIKREEDYGLDPDYARNSQHR
jgi:DNA-binding NarL/FixJ family response regulator